MEPVITGFKAPEYPDQYCPKAYHGDSPPRRDVIAGRLPRGKVIILAGEGDIGKSWLLLEMHRAVNDGAADRVFGGDVVRKNSPCIFLSGEDDRTTLDLRLKTIRQGSKVPAPSHGLLIPCPDLGYMPLVVKNAMGDVVPTDVFEWLDKQLEVQRCDGELGVVVIDTMSTFLAIEHNNNSEGQAALAHLTALATKHDVCVILTHHVAKHSEPGTRASIRGASAIVDASRGAYVFYRAPENEAAFVHDHLPEEAHKGEVLRLQIVKNNLGLRRDPVTYVRQEDGRLLDVSHLLQDDSNPEDALVRLVATYNTTEVKVLKSNLYNMKASDWPPCLFRLSKARLASMLAKLIGAGRLASSAKEGLVAVG